MSIPERFLFDNLVWTSTGDIWATWRLTPLQRPVTENASLTVAAAHRDLFRHLARHEFCLNGALIRRVDLDSGDAGLDELVVTRGAAGNRDVVQPGLGGNDVGGCFT